MAASEQRFSVEARKPAKEVFMIRALALVCVAASVFLLAACGDDDDSTSSNDTSKATQQTAELCSDIVQLNSAVRELQGINSNSTVNELEDAQKAVGDAVNDVKNSAQDVAGTRVDSLESAQNNLNDTVNNLEGEQTIGSAEAEVKTALTGVISARDELNDAANCPSASATVATS
jgi:TolA-binding protein